MRAAWPLDKRHQLMEQVTEWLSHQTSRTPSEITRLLGRVRNGGTVCVLAMFLSLRLQFVLNEAVQSSSFTQVTNKRWWHFRQVHILAEVYADLRLLF